MKGYFGGKEILQVVLGGKTLYKKSSEVELPPPEIITVRVADYLNGYLSTSTVPPTEDVLPSSMARTTDWVKVRPNSSYEMTTSVTNRCLVLLKNSEGEITWVTELQREGSVWKRVFNTGNNIYVRINFYLGNSHNQVKDLILTEQRD